MGKTQTAFLSDFVEAFSKKAPNASWNGGQAKSNTASLLTHQSGRRGDRYNKAERFELGDLTTNFNSHKIIIEFESKQVPISNLLKYWPYLRGELSSKPDFPVVICHFSDWWSYGIHRDLWQWTLDQMQNDSKCIQRVFGYQFDHGGNDLAVRERSISQAVDWALDCARPEVAGAFQKFIEIEPDSRINSTVETESLAHSSAKPHSLRKY